MDLKVRYPLTVIDVETGGLDPHRHALMSIGLVSLWTGEELYLELLPFSGAEISQEALQVNGFPADRDGIWDREAQVLETQALEALRAFFQDEPRLLAGQNPTLDANFLRALRERHPLPDNRSRWPFGHRTFDLHTLGLSWMMKVGKSLPIINGRVQVNLDDILEFCGLSRPEGVHHALIDARVTAQAILHLLSL